MNRDQMNALREVASAAFGYLTSPPHAAMEFRAELAESLEALIAILEEPLDASLPDDEGETEPDRPKPAMGQVIVLHARRRSSRPKPPPRKNP